MSKIYSNDSFERFGDDLCELLLSYLKTFEDKSRTECVSKQFQRCVHQKQYSLSIDEKLLAETRNPLTRLESILRKCPNIKVIKIESNIRFNVVYNENETRIFELIIKYCHQLSALEFGCIQINRKLFKEFFEKFGRSLKSIRFSKQFPPKSSPILELCTNLRELDVLDSNFSLIFDKRSELLVKLLRKITFTYVSKDMNRFVVFVDNNKNSLESVNVRVIYDFDQKAVNCLLDQLSNLTKLRHLKLDINFGPIDYTIANPIKQIAVNCPLIRSFELNVSLESRQKYLDIFDSIKYFKQLKRLELNVRLNNDLSESESTFTTKSLKSCQNLTHLTLYSLRLSDKFFDEINTNLPKLQYLDIYSDSVITDLSFNSLKRLSRLQTIQIIDRSDWTQISDSSAYDLMKTCPKINKIDINFNKFL